MRKEGKWQEGQIAGDRIIWDAPQGTGIRKDRIKDETVIPATKEGFRISE